MHCWAWSILSLDHAQLIMSHDTRTYTPLLVHVHVRSTCIDILPKKLSINGTCELRLQLCLIIDLDTELLDLPSCIYAID